MRPSGLCLFLLNFPFVNSFNWPTWNVQSKELPPFFDDQQNPVNVYIPREGVVVSCNPDANSDANRHHVIKWYKNGQPLTTFDSSKNNTVVRLGSELHFIVADKTTDYWHMLGTYQCSVETKYGKAYSQPVVVHEYYFDDFEDKERIEITVDQNDFFYQTRRRHFMAPRSAVVRKGTAPVGGLCQRCHAPAANPPAQVQWVRRSETTEERLPLPENAISIILPDGGADLCFSYFEKSTDTSPPYYFECIASSFEVQKRGKQVHLVVETPRPREVEDEMMVKLGAEEEYTATVGDTVELTVCATSGYVANTHSKDFSWRKSPELRFPRYVWDFERLDLTSERFEIHNNKTLVLKDVRLNDTGKYSCDFETEMHGKTQQVYGIEHTLRVQGVELSSDTSRGGQSAISGDSVPIKCSGHGNPEPTIRFMKNGQTLAICKPGKSMELVWRNVPGNLRLIDDTFLLANVTEDDSASYQCVAENQLQQRWTNFFLSVSKPKLSYKFDAQNDAISSGYSFLLTVLCLVSVLSRR